MSQRVTEGVAIRSSQEGLSLRSWRSSPCRDRKSQVLGGQCGWCGGRGLGHEIRWEGMEGSQGLLVDCSRVMGLTTTVPLEDLINSDTTRFMYIDLTVATVQKADCCSGWSGKGQR